mmetsp:Transcript_47090/g.138915  ORF Transcript_47090/g.138915 Transcript_47090/m.138915 type:complete len:236 (+) Transcript_47090:605-1312(+)
MPCRALSCSREQPDFRSGTRRLQDCEQTQIWVDCSWLGLCSPRLPTRDTSRSKHRAHAARVPETTPRRVPCSRSACRIAQRFLRSSCRHSARARPWAALGSSSLVDAGASSDHGLVSVGVRRPQTALYWLSSHPRLRVRWTAVVCVAPWPLPTVCTCECRLSGRCWRTPCADDSERRPRAWLAALAASDHHRDRPRANRHLLLCRANQPGRPEESSRHLPAFSTAISMHHARLLA